MKIIRLKVNYTTEEWTRILKNARERRARNIEKLREYNRIYNKKWKKLNGSHNERKWALNNPEKIICQKKAQTAIKHKLLIRGKCEVCGETKTHGHHPDYSKPLSVIWLCPLHHKQLHQNENL